MQDTLNISGLVYLQRFRFGEDTPFSTIKHKNMIVNGGLIFFAEKILGISSREIETIRVGADSAPTTIEHDSMFSMEITSSPVRFLAASSENPGEMFIEAVFGAGDAYTVDEIGLFADDDTMIARTVLGNTNAFTKEATENISVTWRIFLGKELT